MKKLLILSVFLLSACVLRQYNVSDFNSHMFSEDRRFIQANARCESTFLTNMFDSINNELFRCSGDNGSLFIELETDGNNSEDLKTAKIIWKKWHYAEQLKTDSKITAQQYAAIFAEMFARDKKIKFVDSFINGKKAKFNNQIYKIKISKKNDFFYDIHKAEVTFK